MERRKIEVLLTESNGVVIDISPVKEALISVAREELKDASAPTTEVEDLAALPEVEASSYISNGISCANRRDRSRSTGDR